MMEFRNVTKVYKDTGVNALYNITTKIDDGEFVFLIGATGAGKSTVIKPVSYTHLDVYKRQL